ncbi:MAG: hypothetical protein ACKOJH_13070 [Actinomycetota bacterium]
MKQPFVYESCWFVRDASQRPNFLGWPVHMQLQRPDGTWYTPEHTPGVLTDPATLKTTKCPLSPTAMSAVTVWTPRRAGTYRLRHVLVGKRGASNVESSEIVVLVVR